MKLPNSWENWDYIRAMEKHKTVLLEKAIEILKIKKGDVVVDATLGAGGHTKQIAQAVGSLGEVISIDADEEAIEQFKKEHSKEKWFSQVKLIHDNFANLEGILAELKIAKVNAVLADLGWRSEQVSDPKYGMSFAKEALLDMRFDREKQTTTAKDIVNNWPKEDLQDIFWKFAEERSAKKIADWIEEGRKTNEIRTTTALADLVEKAKPKRGKIHPATKIFQALRIAVNNELENLETFLKQSTKVLQGGARIAIISFHSLEDRAVKNFFRTNARGCVCPKEVPKCVCDHQATLRIITRKPIVPDGKEIKKNRRSRSAKMRVAEKIK